MCTSVEHDISKAYQDFTDQLIKAGYFIPSGVPGVYGRSGTFEKIVSRFEAYVTQVAAPLRAEVMSFPPVLNRDHYTTTDHIHNFPQLMGSVQSFSGNEAQHREMQRKLEEGEDWTRELTQTQVMMAPATCYPLYPASTGTLPEQGRTVDLNSFVFRHEPSLDPARLQIFRMREFVRLGTPEQAMGHRDYWLRTGQEILEAVGLKVQVVVANDPFFGRGGKLRKVTQREQDLKHEFVVAICSQEIPTAVGSCNYHLDSFGTKFKIKTQDGQTAHTACLGFGLERVALALLKNHGLDVQKWPSPVREVLGL